MRIDETLRTVRARIVYLGPTGSGKSTNLQQIHERYPRSRRGALLQLDTEEERSLLFDHFTLSLERVAGYQVQIDFYAAPGASTHASSRRALAAEADGIVFVADSSEARADANALAREEMIELLDGPLRPVWSYQWNHRDASDAAPIEAMRAALNPERAPEVEASAIAGVGAWASQRAMLRMIFERERGGPSPARPARRPLALDAVAAVMVADLERYYGPIPIGAASSPDVISVTCASMLGAPWTCALQALTARCGDAARGQSALIEAARRRWSRR